VTRDEVWIGNRIYWRLQHTTRDYTSQITVTKDGQSVLVSHPAGAYDQTFLTVRELRVVLRWGAFSDERRVCRLQLLLVLASAVILGSKSSRIRDHILLSQI
jgi:hypothetical protein